MKTKLFSTKSGSPHPLGSTIQEKGTNFAIFSQHANSVDLLLFDNHDDPQPIQIISLDPKVNKTFHFWHVFVEDLKPGIHYAYRFDGPFDLEQGHRFSKNKLLIDPYAKGNNNNLWDRISACGTEDNLKTSLRSVVIDSNNYDWEGDKPLNRPMSESIIYEMHVGGFTKHESSNVKHVGTFKGVVEKIPYLKELGITAVELLPVFEFDDKEVLRTGNDGNPLSNYWGYSTVSFFAPHRGYCVKPEAGKHLNEFRDMVKALHKAGIEVILDVVFNHTNEGNHQGPYINFKGIDNHIYYHLVENDKQYYMDYSGCGNTLNCNHPVVQKIIVECLEFWVKEMHVDGFRFDEGSILSRGQDGVPMEYPPVVWSIELSEILADTKIIAEAWDAAGCYQIGYFPGYRWAEWNGKYRDDIRRFVKGDAGLINQIASRISGSSDIYQASGHLPINSINFINCHDGFTLNDLVSYNEKHNWDNGESNNDGINDNLSWNCGIEGSTELPDVETLRIKQIKNFITILMLSRGVPMFVMGDEIRRTQNGNNNAYCQDNEISWMNWNLFKKNKDTFRFFKNLIEFRKNHPALHQSRFYSGEINGRGLKDIAWHGTKLNNPGWNDPDARTLSFTLAGFDGDSDIHVMMNMYWDDLEFEVPEIKERRWFNKIDTNKQTPCDFLESANETLVSDKKVTVAGRSIVVLISK